MESGTQLLEAARTASDALFAQIRPDTLYARPIAERHRFLFYLGHLEAFDWNLLWKHTLGNTSRHDDLDELFAFGIDPPPGELPNDRKEDWPEVDEVRAYNRGVRRELDVRMARLPEQALHVAAEHRLMHVETLATMLHRLEPQQKDLPAIPPETSGPVPATAMISIPAGTATLGRGAEEGFRWDNECEPHRVVVPGFEIDKYKVTNLQFLEFVESGGAVPHFWRRHGGRWFWRTMTGDVPLPLDWPVYATRELAEAYASSIGRSLPTEAQFHRAAYATPSGEERLYPWGNERPAAHRGNFDLQRWDPVPVTHHPAGDSAFGVSQLVGNGWEWTSTPFDSFEGFQPCPFYPGYSEPFFDGEHYVLKGGSAQTASPLLRRSFRNWSREGYPHVYAGFRCARS